MIKKILWILALLAITFLSTKVYFNATFPYTHDGENHLARFANYKVAVKEGQIPPRFAPNLVNHYGYPVFNYNYPLANITSLPFSFLKVNYEITFKFLVISSVFLGVLGVTKWLQYLSFSKKAQLFSATAFAFSPYLVTTMYFRGNIGEIMALCILPWLFFLIELFKKQKSKNIPFYTILSAFVWAAFFLSHNITAVFGAGLVLLYFIYRNWALFSKKKAIKKLYPFPLSLVLGFLLSLWFWLPALTEKSEIVLDSSAFFNEYIQHYPTLAQILFSPLAFGFSFISSVDSMSFSIGAIQALSLLLVIILFIKKIFRTSKTSDTQKIVLFLTILSSLLILLQLSITQPFWEFSLIGKYIQFPWRLTLFATVTLIPVIAYVFDSVSKYWKGLLVIILLLQVIQVSRLKPVDQFHKLNRDYDAFPQSTSTLNENLPKTFTLTDIGNWQPTPEILEGSGTITVHKWNGTNRSYAIITNEPLTVVEPTMQYLGWETIVNGKKIEYADSELIQGRIGYLLKPDNKEKSYEISSSFTQKTQARIIGNFISLLTFIGISAWLGYLLFTSYSNNKKKSKKKKYK